MWREQLLSSVFGCRSRGMIASKYTLSKSGASVSVIV